jgi:hypothetical protein
MRHSRSNAGRRWRAPRRRSPFRAAPTRRPHWKPVPTSSNLLRLWRSGRAGRPP